MIHVKYDIGLFQHHWNLDYNVFLTLLVFVVHNGTSLYIRNTKLLTPNKLLAKRLLLANTQQMGISYKSKKHAGFIIIFSIIVFHQKSNGLFASFAVILGMQCV
jgi:hypothetical protein